MAVPNRPFNEPRLWLSVFAASLGVGVDLLGLPLLTIGLFIGPLHAAFGWSRAEVSSASLAINVATFVGAPFIGGICDRFGVRVIALTSLVCLALGFAALASIQASLLAYHVIWFAMSLAAVGTTGIVWTRAVGTLFDRRRGLALGMTLTGTAVAALAGPLVLGPIIASYGWRAGYAALAMTTASVIPVAFILFHDRASLNRATGAFSPAMLVESGDTFRDAIRNAQFWRLGGGIFLVVLGMGSFLVHFVPLAIDMGLTPKVATQMFAIVGASMLIGRIAIGIALDRLNPSVVSSLSLAAPAAACTALLVSPSLASVVFAASVIGFCAGAEIDLLAFLVSRCFGMRHYGAIYGSQLCFLALGSGIGGILTGHLRDVEGSYTLPLRCGVFVFVAGAGLVASIGRLRYRPDDDTLDDVVLTKAVNVHG